MVRNGPPYNEQALLDEVRDILLRKDRDALQRLEDILEQRELLSERVVPIIEEQLALFQEHFPYAYRQAVERLIERKLKESQDELLNLIYPILGKMIRKYIAQQLQGLRESVEAQLKSSFLGRLRARLSGLRESDVIISQAAGLQVQEAYVIAQHSGLLLGSASVQPTIDKELIAGMLTAIKSFAVDAFQRGDAELEMINYGDYQILIQDFYSFYIALAVNGALTTGEKEKLSEQMINFANRELSRKIDQDDPAIHFHLQQQLRSYFIEKPLA
ncbi:MAG: hypothetical protein KDC66_10130 [Phaeodactylibacter sp.]|nr:hypothetical protein [Phaeodactylibacter sp.]MCB9276332.1 hypothetical protein [Lewinellaceae bacterium]